MLQLKTILVPVDFSERSKAAAEHAVLMAKRFDSDLIFVHVMPHSPFEYAAFEGGYYTSEIWPSEKEMEEHLKKQITELASEVALGRPVEKLILKGDPPSRIEQLTREKNVDLIIMPTHGYGPFRRFVLGSVTTKILHDLDCPVLTGAHVPEVPIYRSSPYQHVACAVDLGPHSEEVLRWAYEFARACDAKLSVIHAAPMLDVTPHAVVHGEYSPTELGSMVVRASREKLDKLLKQAGCEAQTYVESADVSRYVPETVKQAGSDVLVIGRSPAEGLLGRLRTHAYALIREAPCPVISV